MLKKKILALSIALFLLCGLPVFSQSTTLSDLEAYHQASHLTKQPGKEFDKGHWAYQSLQHLSKKYGLLLGDENKEFAGNKPLTRNEAAVILVNLVGKIEKDKVQLSDVDKEKVRIMKNEFSSELTMLTGRVAKLESDVKELKGNVSKGFTHAHGEKFRIGGILQASFTGKLQEGADSTAPNFGVNLSEFRFAGKLHDHIDYLASMIASRNFQTAPGIMGDVYVSTDIVPHHTIYLGQTRNPIGHEGTMSPASLPLVSRAQIGRRLGNTRDMGLKLAGNWKYLDYYAGLYNGSGTHTSDTNRDVAGGGWAYLKPLADYPDFGELLLGGGAYSQQTNSAYTSDDYGFFAQYNIGKFTVNSEYGHRTNYQMADIDAMGFYITGLYDLTDKIQLVARYDSFDPNEKIKKNSLIEYTVGTNYFMRGKSLKFQLNGTYLVNEANENSMRVGFLSQYMF